ncbi:MAG TPA: S1/P1 nuclease [Gemmatimonas sp.]|nr:S1/P1 nuclease [Gemmatimonas sp.]
MISILLLAQLAAPVTPPAHGVGLSVPAHAIVRWDAVGHRAMAALAYDRLRPATRARVDALLRQHPDIVRLAEGVDVTSEQGVRELFLRASIWPDRIRSDERFYTETDPKVAPTPLLPGFPTMAKRAEWHYLTRSFSTDGTAPVSLAAPNVVTILPSLADAMSDNANPPALRAYNLSWLIHVVGDLHQPLHGTSRSTSRAPGGDAGGNREWVQLPGIASDSVNLHAVWDGWVGRATRNMPINDVARMLGNALPVPVDQLREELAIPAGAALAATAQLWADESAIIARYVAYDLPPRTGAAPPRLTDAYVAQGEAIARQRLALAAYRLAALLEARLGGE